MVPPPSRLTAAALCLLCWSAFAEAAPRLEVLATFNDPPLSPQYGALAIAPDGSFWGTTRLGGAFNSGTIYKLPVDGSDLQIVASFGSPDLRGQSPQGGLVHAGNGYLWGVTPNSLTSLSTRGTIFKVALGSGVATTVYTFASASSPIATLTPDGQGYLWGSTSVGGTKNSGTIFKVHIGTGQVTTVLNFGGSTAPKGTRPLAPFTADGTGHLWGTTTSGGAGGSGTLFKVNIATGALSTLVEFTGSSGAARGASPAGPLVPDGAGSFLGTAAGGGASGYGTVFKVDLSSGAYTLLGEFSAASGHNPSGGLVAGPGQLFWGTTQNGGTYNGGTAFTVSSQPGSLSTKLDINFPSETGGGGAVPRATMVRDATGMLWGTTAAGGGGGSGTVFRIDPVAETGTTVAQFGAQKTAPKGRLPYGGVVSDAAGQLWGATYSGGRGGAGTIYKLDPHTKAVATVAEFTHSGPIRGYNPRAALVPDGTGHLWGTTSQIDAGYGSVFKINSGSGELTTMVEFTGSNGPYAGSFPASALVPDGHGFLWGTTGFFARLHGDKW